jgi:hypothetical protein
VSCESIEDPLGQPTTDLRPEMKKFGDTSSGSTDAPIIISFPLMANAQGTPTGAAGANMTKNATSAAGANMTKK